tara:strand:- start:458 stop:1183 length:726 start_codon:yes stop_codon:yes gene_type:complete
MNIEGKVALVTGANRGIGAAYVRALLDLGVPKVYAGIRKHIYAENLPKSPNISPIILDICQSEDVRNAAVMCDDVGLLINNAGVNSNTLAIGSATTEDARTEIETNYLGLLEMCKSFAPILKTNGGGVIVNMLTILSKVNMPLMGSYCASKAAGFSLTQALRAELAGQGTRVIAVMPGAVDTRMTSNMQIPKITPDDVVNAALQAIKDDSEEIYPGNMATDICNALSDDPRSIERQFASYL